MGSIELRVLDAQAGHDPFSPGVLDGNFDDYRLSTTFAAGPLELPGIQIFGGHTLLEILQAGRRTNRHVVIRTTLLVTDEAGRTLRTIEAMYLYLPPLDLVTLPLDPSTGSSARSDRPLRNTSHPGLPAALATGTFARQTVTTIWNGRDDTGALVPDGDYQYVLQADLFTYADDPRSGRYDIVTPVGDVVLAAATSIHGRVSVDDTPPMISIEGLSTCLGAPVTPLIHVADKHLSTVAELLDGQPYVDGTPVGEGDHQLIVEATDTAGNGSTSSSSFVVDLTPPVVTIGGVSDGAFVNTSVMPAVQCADAHLTVCTFDLDGSPYASGQSIDAEGSHVLSGHASDCAGHETAVTVHFTIDRTPPVLDRLVPDRCPATEPDPRPPISACAADAGSGVEPGSLTLTVDGTDHAADATIQDGCITWTPPADLAPDEHQAAATVHDRAGNQAQVSWCFAIQTPDRWLSVDPKTIDLGDVALGATGDVTVVVTSRGRLPAPIDAILLDPDAPADLALVDLPAVPTALRAAESVRFTIHFAPQHAFALGTSLFVLGDGQSLRVPVTGLGVSHSVGVIPNAVEFGGVAVGAERSQVVLIANAGNVPLSLQSVTLAPDSGRGLHVGAPDRMVLAPGESAAVSVSFGPTAAGETNGRMDVLSDGGVASVRLHGSGLAPQLTLDPATLAYGPLLLREPTDRTATVRNTGTAPLTVRDIFVDGAPPGSFQLSEALLLPFVISAGDSRAIKIRATAASAAPMNGALVIHTDAGEGRVALSAVGVRPEIRVTPSRVDFGNVLAGSSAISKIAVANEGTATLQVNALGFGPGSSADLNFRNLPVVPLVLDPGDTTEVAIAYTPAEVGGDLGTVQVTSDDPDRPIAEVPAVGGGVSGSLAVEPAVLDFEQVRTGNQSDLALRVLNPGSADLSVTALAVTGGDGAFYVVDPPALPATVVPGSFVTLTLRFAPEQEGPTRGALGVSTSSGAAQVPLLANATRPRLVARPARVAFSDTIVGASTDAVVDLTNGGSAMLVLTEAALRDGGDPAITIVGPPTLPAALLPGAAVPIRVRFSPTPPGDASAVLRVTSDDPDHAALDVAISGRAIEGPHLAATPLALDFGAVPLDASLALDVQLANTGGAPLTISSVGIATGGDAVGFSLDHAPALTALAPGATTLVRARFRPVASGSASSGLEIDSSVGVIIVPLSGSGAADVQPTSLTLDTPAATLQPGDCLALHALAQYPQGTYDVSTRATWTSSADASAAVDAVGLAKAIAPGGAVVTAQYGSLTASSQITVAPAATVRLHLPCGELQRSTRFTATLRIDSGDRALGAYAIRFGFDPAVLSVRSITGAPDGPFQRPPQFDAAALASGSFMLTSYQAESLSSPTGIADVAKIEFEVLGEPGSQASIELQPLQIVAVDATLLPASSLPTPVTVPRVPVLPGAPTRRGPATLAGKGIVR